MTVPTTLADLSVSEASNSPLDADSVTATTRPSDYLRAHAAIMRTLAASSTLAAAGTTDLSSVTGTFVTLTGAAATITALGTLAAGLYKHVIYNAAHTLTHNGTSLILLGAANRTVAAGDSSLFVSEGSGNWRELVFSDATGYQPLDSDLTAIAALTTTAFGRGMLEYADAATAFAALKQAATEAATGVVELATSAEAVTGTDTARAVHPAGGAAAIAALGLGGSSQSWQDVTASRAAGTPYTNSTGKPIVVAITTTSTTGTGQSMGPNITVGGVLVAAVWGYSISTNYKYSAMAVVPPGASYSVSLTGSCSISIWAELS